MKKVSTVAAQQIRNFSEQKLTIGLDLGDRARPSHGRRSRSLRASPVTDTWFLNVRAGWVSP